MYCPKCKESVFNITKDGVDTLKDLGYSNTKYKTPPIVCPDCGTKLEKRNV